jgi:hypothetical protein
MEQFDQVRVIQTVRDRLIHGYQMPNLDEPTKQLQLLVNELITMWKRKESGKKLTKESKWLK